MSLLLATNQWIKLFEFLFAVFRNFCKILKIFQKLILFHELWCLKIIPKNAKIFAESLKIHTFLYLQYMVILYSSKLLIADYNLVPDYRILCQYETKIKFFMKNRDISKTAHSIKKIFPDLESACKIQLENMYCNSYFNKKIFFLIFIWRDRAFCFQKN